MRSLLIFVAILLCPASALADGRVSVRLTDSAGRPIDGQVTLSGQGVTRGCRTVASRCTLSVPAGAYTATIRPTREAAPPARRISVQEGRTVTLAARTQATTARTANTTFRAQPAGTVATRRPTTTRATTAQPTIGTRPAVRTNQPRVTGSRVTATASPVRATPNQVRATPTVYRGTTQAQPRATGTRPNYQVQPRTTATARPRATTASPFVTATPATARPRATATAAAGPTQTAGTVRARNLASGGRLCVQGQVMDGAGRPADATLTVSQSGRVIGTVRSVAGRFSMFDLAPGGYQMSVQSARGGSSNAALNVSGGTSRIVVRVP